MTSNANSRPATTQPVKPAGDATALIKLIAAQIVAEHFSGQTAGTMKYKQ